MVDLRDSFRGYRPVELLIFISLFTTAKSSSRTGKRAVESGSGDGKGQTDSSQNTLVYNLSKGIYWMTY